VRSRVAVNPDATFTFNMHPAQLATLPDGECFLLIQHPGKNKKFDIDLDPADPRYVRNFLSNPDGNPPGSMLFRIAGPGCLKGEGAIEAIGDALNDPAVDDSYTRLKFSVKRP
jgi:hypothetical protein